MSYDCLSCPGFCCTYTEIDLSEHDAKRMAKHLKLSFEKFRDKYLQKGKSHRGLLLFKRVEDAIFGFCCPFLHPVGRICTMYTVRPKVCRGYPYGKSCGYYQFLRWERAHQQDPNAVAVTNL